MRRSDSYYGNDGNRTRLRAFFAVLVMTAFLLTGATGWLFVLAYDYFALLNLSQRLSPLALVAATVVQQAGWEPKEADAEEKRFADQIKFTLILGALTASLADYSAIGGLIAALTGIWTAVEALDERCPGCALYRLLKRHGIEIAAL